MIPLLAASAMNSEGVAKTVKWLGVAIAAIALFFIIRKQFKKYNERKAVGITNNMQGQDGMANVLANRARAAMSGWGTNEKALYDIASVIAKNETTFEKVAAAYYSLFARNLSQDLSSELDSAELAKFYSIMGKTVNGLGNLNLTLT